jgi:uncharacterized membrane protein YgcG
MARNLKYRRAVVAVLLATAVVAVGTQAVPQHGTSVVAADSGPFGGGGGFSGGGGGSSW